MSAARHRVPNLTCSAELRARRAVRSIGAGIGRGARRLMLVSLALLGLAPALPQPLLAKASGKVFVSNEKSSTLTILDQTGKVLQTLETCARPRGMTFNPEHTAIYVGCGDDNTIAVYDIATLRLVRRYRNIAAPETFALHPDGRHLYISNEDDSEMSVLDVETREIVARYPTGPEPEGVQISKDGRLAFVASEVANLVHVVDVQQQKHIKDIPVGTRPRRFALTPDNKELWVSAELSGQVEIIDVETLAAKGKVEFQLRAIRRELFHAGGSRHDQRRCQGLRGARTGQSCGRDQCPKPRGGGLHRGRQARLGPAAQCR